MSDTDWTIECVKCGDFLDGAEMHPLGDGEFVCEDCLFDPEDKAQS